MSTIIYRHAHGPHTIITPSAIRRFKETHVYVTFLCQQISAGTFRCSSSGTLKMVGQGPAVLTSGSAIADEPLDVIRSTSDYLGSKPASAACERQDI